MHSQHLDWFLKAASSIDSHCVLVVCGGFLSSSSGACVSTVHRLLRMFRVCGDVDSGFSDSLLTPTVSTCFSAWHFLSHHH